jgi:hypothetical protein
MSKLTGAALDRAVANAMGFKSVKDCEKWGGPTDEEIQDCYKAAYKVVQGRAAKGEEEMMRAPNGKCVTAGETAPTHTLNSTKTVAVATDTYWMPIDKDTPRSVKLQLLSIGGVAQYSVLQADTSFFTHWCPLPKKRNEVPNL